MKCKVCGKESGKYVFCAKCNQKRENGEIIKCPICGQWHEKEAPCPTAAATDDLAPSPQQQEEGVTSAQSSTSFLYQAKSSLFTPTEKRYWDAIQRLLPQNCIAIPQANLASFILRTDQAHYQNELYRNVDILVTDNGYKPLFVIEINDQSHLTPARRERDEKVSKICEEAGIPIIRLWTSYGVNPDYIQKRIAETLASLPVARISHFSSSADRTKAPAANAGSKKGCYVATCVYGSYDCPPVWTLRRFRDAWLSKRWYGRLFIRFYYRTSPYLVKKWGHNGLFCRFCRSVLDHFVLHLKKQGISSEPYQD